MPSDAYSRRCVLTDYGDGETDELDHELFPPEELRERVGLPCVYEHAADDDPRVLLVFSNRGGPIVELAVIEARTRRRPRSSSPNPRPARPSG